MLSNFADGKDLVTYVPCPVEYTPKSDNFDYDGLHLSKQGYQALGKGICNLVCEILK